jgi:hypothetical protein
MVINYKEDCKPPEYPKDTKWVKIFAWFPIRVDDGRIVWLENVMTLTRTMKYPTDFNNSQSNK